jgi:hypothetical protein
MTSSLPHSAISSWGGFAYQGKVALYHSIRLLCNKSFLGRSLRNFILQLDSTDDFAIYDGSIVVSAHQVKAKVSGYRKTFEDALEKSSAITKDCDSNTVRYFHIANEIDDSSDYMGSIGVEVKFYLYGTKKYCKLDEIESETKELIRRYLTKNSLLCTDKLIDKKYCHLSEFITAKVIDIHAAIHKGDSQNSAAYTKTIQSADLEKIIGTDFNNVDDVPYQLIKLRTVFSYAFEWYVANNTENFTPDQIQNFGAIYRFIYSMSDDDLHAVMCSIRPNAENEQVRKDDVRYYADIVTEITRQIILAGLPHYMKDLRRYLPTSVTLKDRWAPGFKDELIDSIRKNPKLANVLYEYNVLITGADPHSEIKVTGHSNKVTVVGSGNKITSNIVREIPVSIICTETAKKELNA